MKRAFDFIWGKSSPESEQKSIKHHKPSFSREVDRQSDSKDVNMTDSISTSKASSIKSNDTFHFKTPLAPITEQKRDHKRKRSILYRIKTRNNKQQYEQRLKELTPYDAITAQGFQGSKRDYDDLLNYALQVQQHLRQQTSRPSSQMSIYSDHSSAMSWSQTTSQDQLERSSIQSSNHSFVMKPPPPVNQKSHLFQKEQTWIKQLRERINEIFQKKSEDEEIKLQPIQFRKEKQLEIDEDLKKRRAAKKTTELPTLTDAIRNEIQTALKNPPDTQLVEAFNIPIHQRDLKILSGSDWLNDEIINFYYNLIMQRSKENKNLPSVYVFNTFFFTKIKSGGHASVKRWTRKVNIFEYDLILFPVHLSIHWCSCLIDLKQKKIEYYDSLHGQTPKFFKIILEYLRNEYKEKYKQEFPEQDWSFDAPKNIPAQQNGYDCGVFSCIFAEYASRRAVFDFSQSHMKYFRNRMIYEILNTKLLMTE